MINEDSIRLFFGLPINPEDGDDLKARFQPMVSRVTDELRWVDSEKYHVTIRFIPEFPKASLEKLIEAISSLILPALHLRVLQISEFPTASGHLIVGNVRLSSELAKLFHSVSGVLDNLNVKREHHSFRPHITLGKIKRKDKNNKNNPIEKMLLPNYEMPVGELILYQSILEDTGSRYVPLHRFPLKKM
jgi:2'-5' RNA ligase